LTRKAPLEYSSFPETIRFVVRIGNLENKYQAIPFLFQIGFGRLINQGEVGFQDEELRKFLKRNKI
jgi:hypothetical protein